ncbi:MAG: hypothetical protein IKS02_08050, partial [Fibrobacter sp.]|nr:hypothetical protein [Fibrobacter sp.]
SVMECKRGDSRFGDPAPEILHRLALSRQKAEQLVTREMRCPICGFLVQIIPVTQKEIVFVKCHKCKFSGPLDPAYFRRQKRLGAYMNKLKESTCKRKR